MAKVRIQATAEDIAKGGEDRGDFVVPKPGFYILTMTECNPGHSKGEDGEEDKSKPRLECIYKITGVGREEAEPTENYGNIWDYVSFSKSSGWKRGEFLKAFGYVEDASSDVDVEIDTDDVINRKVLARIKHEKAQKKGDPARAKVATLFRYGSDPSAIDDEGEVVYGDAQDEPFGAEVEADDTPDREELEAMDLKTLGVAYTEAGHGDPRDLLQKDAKGKVDADATKAALIAVLLGEEEDDSSDPF